MARKKKQASGDVYDRQYQEDLFNTFLVAAYVYDDGNRLKLVFNCFGDSNTVDLDLCSDENNDNSSISNEANCGNLFAQALKQSTIRELGEHSSICMVGSVFVLLCPLPTVDRKPTLVNRH